MHLIVVALCSSASLPVSLQAAPAFRYLALAQRVQ